MQTVRRRRTVRYCGLGAMSALGVAASAPGRAQVAEPWAEIETTSVMVGIGGQSGDGRLSLPNLGANCVYPFKVG